MQTVEANDEHTEKARKYITMVRAMGESTARGYESRLKNFSKYVLKEYRLSIDSLVNDLVSEGKEKRKLDPYDILSGYAAYLLGKLSSNTIKQRVVTAKNFLEYYDVEISPRKYKIKVG